MIVLDGVWLDDRRACTWSWAGVSLAVEAGRTLAVRSLPGNHAGDDLIDLLERRRHPVAGEASASPIAHVSIDATSGERRAVLSDGTVVVAHPTAATAAEADIVVTLDHGAVMETRQPAPA